MSWAERAADRSPSVQRSRDRSVQQAQQIVSAARRLTVEKGDQFTTQELAKEAGVAVQTFYRYFQTKDHLLLAVFENLLADAAERMAEQAHGLSDPMDRLRFLFTVAFSSLGVDDQVRAETDRRFTTSQHWRLYELFPDEMQRAGQPFEGLIAEALRGAQELGRIDVEDTDDAAVFVARVLRATFHEFAYAKRPVDIADLLQKTWTFCLQGLRAGPEAC